MKVEASMQWQRMVSRRFLRLRRRLREKALGKRTNLARVKLVRNGLIALLVIVVVGMVGVVGLFAWYAKDLPQPDKIVRRDGFATKILDRSGILLYEVFEDEQRTPVTFDQVPLVMRQATIAIEDKDFYKHQGFDPFSLLRIGKNVITKQRLIGGSTLTQQLVKNVLLSSERTIPRKIKEFILAVQIESKYSKDEILQMYLNEVPYGGPVWGVGTAAEEIFNKSVEELNLVESAILAGIPQRPPVYSPIVGKSGAYVYRTKDVLRRMREDGYISEEQEASAGAMLENYKFASQSASMKAPHFVTYVKEILEDQYGEDLVERGGLTVTTTLDYEIQEQAQQIVAEEIAKVKNAGIGNGAALVTDPETGQIWAMVGSYDFFAEDYEGQVNVTTSLRQPGSTIKPVTYVTAFKKGYSPASVLMDVPTEFVSGDPTKPYIPVNYDGSYRGPIQLRFALGSSLNVPAVKLLALVGIENMLQTAEDMGLSTLAPTKENLERFGLSVTLGGGEVRLIDLVNAYGSFANGGFKLEPISVLKVENRDGRVLFEHKDTQGKRILESGETFLINHILSDNNARLLTFGSNSYLNMGTRAVAVKTGTTNDKRDNWTIGWSRGAVVGVWVGNNDNSPMKNVASGVTGASPIWRKIMLAVLEKVPAEAWEIPDTVEAVKVDVVSGYPEHDGYASRAEYVIKGTLPPLPDPIHTKVKLCRGQNKLASVVDIAKNEFEEKEFYVFKEDYAQVGVKSWQQAIDDWTRGSGDEKYKVPTEYCGDANQVEVSIEEPPNEKNFDETSVNIRVRVTTQGTVDRVEVFVDDKLETTLKDRPYEVRLDISKGKHRLRVKAIREDGQSGESGEIRIGTGGALWNEGEVTPTPTSVINPSVTPVPTQV